MSLLASVFGFRGPMAPADKKRWAQARSLADLGELTAQWLEGRIGSQPGYYGPVDVDEKYAPGLTKALIACNRHGYLTNDSQAGFVGEGYRGQVQQHADVFGFADPKTYARLRTAVQRQGFRIYAWPVKPRRRHPLKPLGNFGLVQMGAADIETSYDGVPAEALDALRGALQVTIYDPKPGRNSLWRELERAARRWLR